MSAGDRRNPSRLDVVVSILSVLLVGGFYVDLWAHSHGRVDESFFTPWHALLYAAAGLFGGVLLGKAISGRRRGASRRESLPEGYGLSLIGAGLFLVAGVGDLAWHTAFGIEEDVSALLSPTHLALAASGVFMVFGPVRSAWAKGVPDGFPRWLPWVVSLTMALAIMAAFTQYAHPAMDTWPEQAEADFSARSDLLLVQADGSSQTRIPIADSDQVWMPDFSADGRLVVSVVSGEVGRLVVMGADGSDRRVVYEGAALFHHADWSPDGSLIAFNAEADDGNSEIFVVSSEGGEPRRLTDDPGIDWGPTWSPDGSQIAFSSDRDGNVNLFVVAAAGGPSERLTDLSGDEAGPAWSPDGSLIAFDMYAGQSVEVAVISPEGGEATALTADPADDSAPAWSPDGSRIAFASNRTGQIDLYSMAADGSGATNLTNHPQGHDGWAGSSWAPDGSAIATNSSGFTQWWAEPYVRDALGVASLLIQAALIAGFMLVALRHGPLPVGSLTILVGVSGAMMTALSDLHWYIGVALLAGVIGDVLVAVLRPGPARVRPARIVVCAVLAVWYALYLLYLGVWGEGLGWSIHMVLGGPILAATVGLLLSFVAFPGSAGRMAGGGGAQEADDVALDPADVAGPVAG
jgi:Tol biopolymer transport system component